MVEVGGIPGILACPLLRLSKRRICKIYKLVSASIHIKGIFNIFYGFPLF